MVLITQDAGGMKRFFAGFYRDNTVCWSIYESVALDKSLGELQTIVQQWKIESYNIRESISANPSFSIPAKK